jgi:hypothetical protein
MLPVKTPKVPALPAANGSSASDHDGPKPGSANNNRTAKSPTVASATPATTSVASNPGGKTQSTGSKFLPRMKK